MIFKKKLFLIGAMALIVFLCSCYSNRKLDYDIGTAEGYRFYQGFNSTLSDGSDEKPLFESIKIDETIYSINQDDISTFYYEDSVACIYKYDNNKWAIIDYDIKNDSTVLIETYSAEKVQFMMPNYYPVFYVEYYSNGNDYLVSYNLLHGSKIIESENELQSINSYGYFSLIKGNTTYTSFTDDTSFAFNSGYQAVYNISNLERVYLYNERDNDSGTISFNCLSLAQQEIEAKYFGQIEKAIDYKNVYFRNMYYSIWIEDIDNSLYLSGLGIDNALIMEVPYNYTPGYHLEYYKEFNCIIADYSSSLEFTYSLDYKSFSQKTFKSYKEESFKYQMFEGDKYVFSSENIYTRLHPTGAVELDTYLLRYDKTKSKYEIMQKKHVYGFSDAFAFDYVLPC